MLRCKIHSRYTAFVFGSKRWKASRVCRQQRPLVEENTYLAVTLDSWNKFLNKSLTCMFDGSHNFAITFLCAKGSVQANISSDVLPTANFIEPVQLGALYTISASQKTNDRVLQRKQLMSRLCVLLVLKYYHIALLETILIIAVKSPYLLHIYKISKNE